MRPTPTKPEAGLYRIEAVQTTSSGSRKVVLQSEDDKFADPLRGIYVGRDLQAPVEVGVVANADFELVKKEDSAYLRLVSWCAPGTQPTYSPKANALQGDSKDKMIVAQVAFKCASWFYAASGCPEDEAAARILDLAHDLMKGMYELARGA